MSLPCLKLSLVHMPFRVNPKALTYVAFFFFPEYDQAFLPQVLLSGCFFCLECSLFHTLPGKLLLTLQVLELSQKSPPTTQNFSQLSLSLTFHLTLHFSFKALTIFCNYIYLFACSLNICLSHYAKSSVFTPSFLTYGILPRK
jgi:hypothetical protein